MANWTPELIEEFVTGRVKQEIEQAKKSGQKLTPDSLAHALADFIRAFMANARHRELRKLQEFYQQSPGEMDAYLGERLQATKTMAQALQNYAEKREKERT